MAPADELVRVVRGGDGSLLVGRSLPGRGAWLCAGSPSCAALAARRGAFGRALRAPVDPAAVERLLERLREGGDLVGRGAGRSMCEDGEPGCPSGGRRVEGR